MKRFETHRSGAGGTRRRARGFTVVELITVIALAAIFASLAGPPFRDFIIQQRIRNAAFDLMSDITFARSEAVKRNATVTISKVGTWTGGWTVAAGATTLRTHPALNNTITITMGASSIDFALNGRASSLANFTIDDTGGSATISARCVSIDPSGRPQSVQGSCS
ncbi:MAG TPA: GspH/FimT family pseudopilin [Vicinamibacterales bacterium]|nr:GspH/FimT family pseudopilin [Vicinamibacterales bacterium]